MGPAEPLLAVRAIVLTLVPPVERSQTVELATREVSERLERLWSPHQSTDAFGGVTMLLLSSVQLKSSCLSESATSKKDPMTNT